MATQKFIFNVGNEIGKVVEVELSGPYSYNKLLPDGNVACANRYEELIGRKTSLGMSRMFNVDDDPLPSQEYDAAIRAYERMATLLTSLLACLSHLTIEQIRQALEAILEEVL